MYSEKKTQEDLDRFEKSVGWRPTAHTLEEVEEFKKYVDSITKVETNSRSSYVCCTENITPKRQENVKRWIENEQAMCSIDCSYFESRYAFIRNESGEMQKFKNRKSQVLIDAVMAEAEDQDRAIELLIVTGRQCGIRTKAILRMFHRALFVPYTTLLLAGATGVHSEFIQRMCNDIYESLPWWLVPMKTKKGKLSNKSITVSNSWRSTNGIAGGFTPQCIYVGDIREIANPMKTIEEGLLRAVFSSARTFMVLQGSISLRPGWVNSTYADSKRYWGEGKSRLRSIFVPWFVNFDLYTSADWLKKYPVPKRWKPLDKTVNHVTRCELFAHSTDYLSTTLGKNWKMPIETKWWWEESYKRAKATHTLDTFLLQMTPDDSALLGKERETEPDEIDLDNLFPAPTAIQEKIAAMASR